MRGEFNRVNVFGGRPAAPWACVWDVVGEPGLRVECPHRDDPDNEIDTWHVPRTPDGCREGARELLGGSRRIGRTRASRSSSTCRRRTVRVLHGFGGDRRWWVRWRGCRGAAGRAGPRDVTLFERAARLGGVGITTPIRAPRATSRRTVRVLVRAEPGWSRRYAPQAEIQAYVEDVARRSGVDARLSTEVSSARWDGSRWVLSTSAGQVRRRRADHGVRAAPLPHVPPLPASARSPERRSTRRAGAMTCRWRASGSRWSARAAARSRSSPRSRMRWRPGRLPALPGWTIPKLDFPYPPRVRALFARFPALQRLDRAGNCYFHEFFTHGMVSTTGDCGVLEAAGTAATSAGASRTRRCGGGHPDRPRRLQADDAHRRLVPGAVAAECRAGHRRASPRSRRSGMVAGRRRAAGRRARARHRLQEPRVRRADGDPGPAAARWPTPGTASHAPTSASPSPASRTSSCSTARIPTAAPARSSRRSSPRSPTSSRRCANSTAGGRLARSRSGPRPRTPSTFVRAALAGTVWHSGCTNWYVDDEGNDPSNWPWTWPEYRRRTA